MMWWWYGGHAGFGLWGWISLALMIAFWALVILGFVTLVRYLAAGRLPESGTQAPRATAEDILRERFARGEIDGDEYRTRLQLLRSKAERDSGNAGTAA